MPEGRGEGGESSLVAELLDVEETTLGSDVLLSKVFNSVDDRRSDGTRYSVVVRLANAADGGNVRLEEVVLGEIYSRETG